MKRLLVLAAALAAFWVANVAVAVIVIRGPVPPSAPPSGPTLIVSDASATGGASLSSMPGNINTTGANFIVVLVGSYVSGGTGYTFSDSYSNTWTAVAGGTSTDLITRIFYCYSPTVGSAHNFSVSGANTYASILILAFSGVASSPYDTIVTASSNSSHTSLATGSASPAQANTLWITGGSFGGTSGSGMSPDSGFATAITATDVPSTRINGFLSYKSVSSTSSVNVTWTVGETATQGTVFLAAFKY